jgi:hypothetical protein
MHALNSGSIGSATISTGCPHWCLLWAVFIIKVRNRPYMALHRWRAIRPWRLARDAGNEEGRC